MTAHPRSRGEHWDTLTRLRETCGSSPLARGTRTNRRHWVGRRRLIPARAGNTGLYIFASSSRAAHPRSRGEHFLRTLRVRSVSGSSPLARGTLPVVIFQVAVNRLIPARAGNTSRNAHGTRAGSAHPRSRGEHFASLLEHAAVPGSSPLARGTLRLSARTRGRPRLIPARAGNTCALWLHRNAIAAHPRSRGEHALILP